MRITTAKRCSIPALSATSKVVSSYRVPLNRRVSSAVCILVPRLSSSCQRGNIVSCKRTEYISPPSYYYPVYISARNKAEGISSTRELIKINGLP